MFGTGPFFTMEVVVSQWYQEIILYQIRCWVDIIGINNISCKHIMFIYYIFTSFITAPNLAANSYSRKFSVGHCSVLRGRVDCWSSFMGMNHNWLRISRVLHCLGMIGKKDRDH